MQVLIVGCGRWGQVLVKKFAGQLGAENLIVADKDPSRLTGLPYRWTTDWASALPEVDAVVVATQPKDHFAIAEIALLAGKHVLVEKPMTMESVTARHLLELAKAQKKTLMTDSTFLYEPAAMAILHPEATHHALQFYWCNPKVSAAEDSVLWVNGPHPVALALAAGGPNFEVKSAHLAFDYCSFDLWMIRSKATIVLSWQTKAKTRVIVNGFHDNQLKWDIDFFDDRVGKQLLTNAVLGSDALDRMCAAFIRRCGPEAPWYDERGVQVVEVLEAVEKAGKG